MTAQVVALKRQLQVQKPMGQRLDNVRAAQARAAKRLEQANIALNIAQETVQIANVDYAKVSAEVLELETSIGGDSSTGPGDSMSGLKENLSSALAQLAAMEGVSEGTTADAIAWSEATMARLQATFTEAANHMAATAASVKRKHSTKSHPVVGVDVGRVSHRTIGKDKDPRSLPPRKPASVVNHFKQRVPDSSDSELLLDALDLSSSNSSSSSPFRPSGIPFAD